MAENKSAAGADPEESDAGQATFVFDVDGVTCEWNRPRIRGDEVMELADIPLSEGLVLCHEDGSQEAIAPDQEVDLVSRPRFKQRPRFKRGMR
jgi:Multiubiquitin